jgi:uncharacterized protein (TIGR02246 family)
VTIRLEQAYELPDRRNRAFAAADLDAFLSLWSDDCVVEGPEHLLRGKAALRAVLEQVWTNALRPIHMTVHGVAVQGDVIFYEWAFVAEMRASGQRIVQSGMTAHGVDAQGRCHFSRP